MWRLRASLGVFSGSFGGPLGDFLGSLDVLLAAVGSLGAPLGVPGGSWDVSGRLGGDFRDLQEIPGRLLASFRSHLFFFSQFCYFLCFYAFLFGLSFLIGFWFL